MVPIALHEKAVQNSFYMLQRDGVHSVAVTSARKGEGVSAFAYALARRAATAGVKVLLIDFNFSNPSQTLNLALERHPWFPHKPFHKTNIVKLSNTNMSVLGAPSEVKDRWPFQDREKLKSMLEGFHQEYDLVIADMPSILDGDARLQAEIACAAFEGALIVTLASRTVETEISKMRDILEQANVKILGAVMNDQCTPSLKEELCRQLSKVEPPWERVSTPIRRWVEGNSFLNQSL